MSVLEVASGGEDPEARKQDDEGLEDIVARHFHFAVGRLVEESRPYFDLVDTKTFLRRVVYSIVPRSKATDVAVKPDLYGPLLLGFAVASALRFNAGYALGAALAMSFTSVMAGALLVSLALQYNTVRDRQLGRATSGAVAGTDRALSVVGYSLSGPLLLMLAKRHVPHLLLFISSLLVEGATAISLGVTLYSAMGKARPELCAAVSGLHVLWLFLLL